jgi:hypothetical protein
MSGGAEERRQLAQRIAAALRARRDAAASASSGEASPSSPGALPPDLPSGSGAMDSAEHVLAQIQDALKEVKGYLVDCVAHSGGEVGGFQAALSLTGDPDVGTLIDASALSSRDGTALPPQLDDCVRGVMQGLELPAMSVGDAYKVTYDFQFESQPTKEMKR